MTWVKMRDIKIKEAKEANTTSTLNYFNTLTASISRITQSVTVGASSGVLAVQAATQSVWGG